MKIKIPREDHAINKIGWLRAAVLGANDGILSTTSLIIGVASASTERAPVVLAAVAGLVAGAMSMAAGEYVSVSSQSDVEKADLEKERKELEEAPAAELEELALIYEKRGLETKLAHQVATQLMHHNALEAHARDELGINEITQAKPLQAAWSSAASFISGGTLPLLVTLFAPVHKIVIFQYVSSILILGILGAVSAHTGGAKIGKSVLRVCFWGTIAMCLSALIGHFFGEAPL